MTDTVFTIETAAPEVVEEVAVVEEPKVVTWYLWKELTGSTTEHTFGQYTGFVTLYDTDPQPHNSCKYNPGEEVEGQTIYRTSMGWFRTKSELDLERIKLLMTAVLETDYRQTTQGKYTEFEQSFWAKQEAAARDYLATGNANVFIQTLFDGRSEEDRDEDLEAFCKDIIAKADEYSMMAALALAEYQNKCLKVKRATQLADLAHITEVPISVFVLDQMIAAPQHSVVPGL